MSNEKIVELNVGGCTYTTTLATLTKIEKSRLAKMFNDISTIPVDSKSRYFINRDGQLFRYVIDYLRDPEKFSLPENFSEKSRLKQEAEFYELSGLVAYLVDILPKGYNAKQKAPSVISLGYRGTFAFGRDGLADVKFRKLSRILVAGKSSLCKEVFGDSLNESRDPDRGSGDRYSSRYFLKHCVLEQAFDLLYASGFEMVGCCGSGTNSSGMEIKPGQDSEENKWQHYNEFIFLKRT